MAQTVKCLSTVWETWVWSLGWEVPRRRKWQPTPVLLPRKSHGRRSLVFMGSHRVRHDWATSLSIDYFSLENYYQYCKFLHGADIKTSLCEWDYVSICNMYIGLQNTCSETHIYIHIPNHSGLKKKGGKFLYVTSLTTNFKNHLHIYYLSITIA